MLQRWWFQFEKNDGTPHAHVCVPGGRAGLLQATATAVVAHCTHAWDPCDYPADCWIVVSVISLHHGGVFLVVLLWWLLPRILGWGNTGSVLWWKGWGHAAMVALWGRGIVPLRLHIRGLLAVVCLWLCAVSLWWCTVPLWCLRVVHADGRGVGDGGRGGSEGGSGCVGICGLRTMCTSLSSASLRGDDCPRSSSDHSRGQPREDTCHYDDDKTSGETQAGVTIKVVRIRALHNTRNEQSEEV